MTRHRHAFSIPVVTQLQFDTQHYAAIRSTMQPCSCNKNAQLQQLAWRVTLQVLRAADDWPGLNEHILLLAKRRSQLKQAVQAFVRQAMGYVDEAPDEGARVELIKTLQSVTEGKARNRLHSIPPGGRGCEDGSLVCCWCLLSHVILLLWVCL